MKPHKEHRMANSPVITEFEAVEIFGKKKLDIEGDYFLRKIFTRAVEDAYQKQEIKEG